MRRDLLLQLTSAGLTLFWTVLIGDELNNTDPVAHPGSEYRWVSASASYFLGDGTVNLISADAARCAPGPETERTLKWTHARPTADRPPTCHLRETSPGLGCKRPDQMAAARESRAAVTGNVRRADHEPHQPGGVRLRSRL